MKGSLISQILDPKDIHYCILEILLSNFIVNSDSLNRPNSDAVAAHSLKFCLIKLHVGLYHASLLLMSVLVIVI